jgi:type II secretory ATPase GspE/PulE/Tfp pilus assembly ATPase PilB-like protein/DNA-binding response OmpR family regulator
MTNPARPVILCVDDSADWRALMDALLTEAGYDLIQAGSAREGLDRLRKTKADLLLLDVGLPDMDGYALCSELQKSPDLAYIPVIFLTARDTDQDKARAFAAGGVDFLIKQAGEQAVLETIRKHLRTRLQWNALNRDRRSTDFNTFKEFVFKRLDLAPEFRARLAGVTAAKLQDLAEALGITPTQVATLAAEFLKLTFLSHIRVDDVHLGVLPLAFCQANHVIALRGKDGEAGFAVVNPFQWGLLDELKRLPVDGAARRIYVTEPAVLRKLFGAASGVEKRAAAGVPAAPPGSDAARREAEAAAVSRLSIDEIEQELQSLYHPLEHVSDDADEKGDSAPVIQLIERLINNAIKAGASDVHIEPWESEVVVRYRIDGDLREIARLQPRRLILPIVSRIKIISKLDIAERRLPQDGRIVFRDKIDLRVSVAPQNFGEKVVLRILDQEKAFVPLDRLGFSPRHLAVYREKIRTPYGLVLHVGPTGSGKTTTLFAALAEVRDPALNIQTIEDPIEYTLPGINQMQVRPDIGLTFQRALRSFLRQDPDVILVGEIRDHETATVAVEAALTGHLLLSTLHTNDATATLTRFLEMGIEPFLVSSSIVMVCAQRLIRRLCPRCRQSFVPGERERQLAGLPEKGQPVLYRAKGCPECGGAGYKGRVGIHELLVVDDAVRSALTGRGVTSEGLKHLAVGRGMTTLYWDAMEKARAGLTSIEEVFAQVRADEFDSRPAWMFEELGLPRPAPGATGAV